MIGHIVGAPAMMQLGGFQFGISTAAYQELSRRSSYRWAQQDLYGRLPGLQHTGQGEETITLSGVIYPEYRGGFTQVEQMRTLAGEGQPLSLVSGSGTLLGRWVIESVEEKQVTFAAYGMPRKQEFTLQLKRHPDAVASVVATAAAVAGAATEAVKDVATAKTAFGKFLDSAASTVGGAISTMTSTVAAVQAKAAEIGNAVAPVVATVSRGISTARQLQAQVASAKQSLGNLSSLANIQSAAYGVMSAASAASNAGAFAADAAKSLGINIDVPATSASTLQLVKDCEAVCGKAAATASGIYSGAADLVKSVTSLGD